MRIIVAVLAVVAAVSVSMSACAFAQEERLTISTFFPAPYGVYNEMETNILYMVPQDPTVTLCKKEGQVIYDKFAHILKVCDGARWVLIEAKLDTQTVYRPATAPMTLANGLWGWGATATCPPGTKLVGGGGEWGSVFSPHHGTYAKPTENGDGWTCFISPTQGNMAGGYRAGDGCSNLISCANHTGCQAVCTKAEEN